MGPGRPMPSLVPPPCHRKRARVVPPGFGPQAPDVAVTPRRGEDGSDTRVQKPHTGMTIRITPELLARLLLSGSKPSIELDLKSVAEGGPVLIVDGIRHNTHAHQMAIGSEVHMLARTESPSQSRGEEASSGRSMSMHASLHQKLIVQQVLTAAKRAEIRARTEDSARQIQEAKKTNMLVIDDQDEMLAAAEAIPLVASAATVGNSTGNSSGAGGAGSGFGQDARVTNGDQRGDGKRLRQGQQHAEEANADANGGGDPYTAWFYDCYNHDDYTGHVSDLRKFLSGIDMGQVMFRYHVKSDGRLDPDRRRFCVKFKTKAGCDLAIARSGEALGAGGSWSPDSVVVIRGKRDTGEDVPGAYLLVLPPGSSVGEVLAKVKARLPPDLKPAVMSAKSLTQSETERRELPKQHGRAVLRGDDLSRRTPQTHSAKENRRRANRELVEAYRRDMKRSALGATIASAVNLGPEWRSPEARLVGTAEDNAHRVATLAATQASRMLSGRSEAEEGTLGSFGTEASTSDQRGRHLTLPSGPMGGARERRRAAGEVARLGEEQRMTPQQ